MKTVSLTEAKARLRELLRLVEKGHVVTIARRNLPIAEIRPVAPRAARPRPFGLCRGDFRVPDDFNAPLPPEIVRPFDGG